MLSRGYQNLYRIGPAAVLLMNAMKEKGSKGSIRASFD
jgi:hypothetical protein